MKKLFLFAALVLVAQTANATIIGQLGFENQANGVGTTGPIGGELGYTTTVTQSQAGSTVTQQTSSRQSGPLPVTVSGTFAVPAAPATRSGAGTTVNVTTETTKADTGKTGNGYYYSGGTLSGTAGEILTNFQTDNVTFNGTMTARQVSFGVFINNTSYETGTIDAQDYIKLTLVTNLGNTVIFDSTAGPSSGDLDAQVFQPQTWYGTYATVTQAISDSVTTAALQVQFAGNSSTGAEVYALDNIQFSATIVPEPSSFVLAGFALVGLVAAIRRRKA